ncbi:hypothetical protein [Nonomuraea sp. NPDC049709]|uniref:hypothetical protein n=1 Tax=Nonomuraea sp. NPDC049709 TaxID=3154736 RepID=UPI003416D221
MSDATATTYEWLYQEWTDGTDDTWLCVCFVGGVSPAEALRRLGVAPGPVAGDYGFGIAAYRARGGAVLVEAGWGNVPDRLQVQQRELGMETSYEDPGWTGAPAAAALALAERATGVHLSRARYAADALFGPTEHLAPYA